MSVQAISWAFDQECPATEKLVLLALADHANMEGQCWPSQTKIAQRCSLSRGRVNKAFGKLEELGFLSIVPRERDNGSTASSMVVLNVPSADREGSNPAETVAFIYVASDGEIAKIGFSRDPDSRVKQLRHSACRPNLELIKTFAMDASAARRIERAIHEQNSTLRAHGEWYNIPPEQAVSLVIKGVTNDDTPLSSTVTPPVTNDDTPLSPSMTPLETTNNNQPIETDTSNARELFEELWVNIWTPVGKRRSISKDKVFAFYQKAAKKAGSPERLNAACKRWVMDRSNGAEKFAPGLHLFLRDGKWEHYLQADGVSELVTLDQWQERVRYFYKFDNWNEEWGPTPDQPGCLAPASVLEAAA